MSNFAVTDSNDVVVQVIVIEQDVIDTGLFGDPASFERTSYNTRGGIYYTPNTNTPDPDQSKAFRKNYAGIGYKLDRVRDAFIPPQDYPSWHLNESTCLWEAPTPLPQDGKPYRWDEPTLAWVETVAPTP
ncbi:hypothetical protein UFOVP151_38 [uncultured Caudovirales phage]|uniref:Uncharacterized protein n=1 Tax=uncultured Caudovirales phage TaxID=2100421 RepID=A0A6J7W9C0_9CAUD|nr:hypothetical protein UFOVP151_38 [uncultured Caudovirales phage]